MNILDRNSKSTYVVKDDYRNSLMAALNAKDLNNTLGQFYQDLVLRENPTPEKHVAKLREILEGKT